MISFVVWGLESLPLGYNKKILYKQFLYKNFSLWKIENFEHHPTFSVCDFCGPWENIRHVHCSVQLVNLKASNILLNERS